MDCSVDQFISNKQGYTLIDVRSPIEFEEGHIPQAINIPLFSNDERAQVGLTFKQKGKKQAQWLGMEIVSPKIPQLLHEIKEKKIEGKHILIYCYRGGLRSQSVTQFCLMAGLHVFRLGGGYKEYRKYIHEATEKLIPKTAYVLHGLTGTGKTEILHKLKEKGIPVLDLEGLAGHKGSLFGHIGQAVKSQKMFDALLFDALDPIQTHPFVLFEAESKRIGRAIQPSSLLKRKEEGTHIIVTCSLEKRVERIKKEYIEPFEKEEWFIRSVEEIISMLWKRMRGNPVWKDVSDSWQNKEYNRFISLLLECYYDPMYLYKLKSYGAVNDFYTVQSDDIDAAINEIQKYVTKSQIIYN